MHGARYSEVSNSLFGKLPEYVNSISCRETPENERLKLLQIDEAEKMKEDVNLKNLKFNNVSKFYEEKQMSSVNNVYTFMYVDFDPPF